MGEIEGGGLPDEGDRRSFLSPFGSTGFYKNTDRHRNSHCEEIAWNPLLIAGFKDKANTEATGCFLKVDR